MVALMDPDNQLLTYVQEKSQYYSNVVDKRLVACFRFLCTYMPNIFPFLNSNV